MTFSETVRAAMAKGWGVTDERKMMKAFGITRAMAEEVARACEDEYVADLRAAKLRGASLKRGGK